MYVEYMNVESNVFAG